jgi:hypothetical protein
MGQFREYAQAGLLLSYPVSLPQVQGRDAAYVDRILKGDKPGDLPIEQPTKFELVIKSQDGNGARARDRAGASGARRRGDRMSP